MATRTRPSLLPVAGFLLLVHAGFGMAQTSAPESPPPVNPAPPLSPPGTPPSAPTPNTPPSPVYNTIWEVVANRSDLSSIKLALTGQQGVFNDSSLAITAFLPTNAAFAALAASLGLDSITGLIAYYQSLFEGIKYHSVLPVFTIASLITDAGGANKTTYYDTRLTTPYTASYTRMGVNIAPPASNASAPKVTVIGISSTAGLVDRDISAGASYVNVVDTFLQHWYTSIDDALQRTPNISTMYQALKDTNVMPQLTNDTQVYSLFVPTNAAFASAKAAFRFDFTKSADTLRYHVVTQPISLLVQPYTTELPTDPTSYPTLNGAGVKIYSPSVAGDQAVLTPLVPGNPSARVTMTSIRVGVQPTFYINVINQVLIPTYTTVWQVINSTAAYGTLKVLFTLDPSTVRTLQDPTSKTTLFAMTNQTWVNVAKLYGVTDLIAALASTKREMLLRNLVATSNQSVDSLKAGVTMDTLHGPRALTSGMQVSGLVIYAEKSLAGVVSPFNISVLYGQSYVHTVNDVLIPKGAEPGSSAAAVPSLVLLVVTALAGRLLVAQLW